MGIVLWPVKKEMNRDHGVNVATDSDISIPLNFAFDMAAGTYEKKGIEQARMVISNEW